MGGECDTDGYEPGRDNVVLVAAEVVEIDLYLLGKCQDRIN